MTQVAVRWRNDFKPQFENERQQEVSGNLDWCYFHTPGIYRTRQYEIVHTDATPMIIIAMQEEVELLDY